VPVAYGHQDVWIRGHVDEAGIGCRGEIIARHRLERADVVFDLSIICPLIEQTVGSMVASPRSLP